MKWAGCNYWVNQGKHPLEPIGTATSMHDCSGCEHADSCPLQQEAQVWPHDEGHDKRSIEVTNEWKRQERAARLFSDWQTTAEKHAISIGCPDGLWAEDDPYDLIEAARVAYAEGQSAVDFINEMFADDIASRKHDELMAAEAEERAEEDT